MKQQNGNNTPAAEEEYFSVADKDFRRFRDIERAAVYTLGWVDAALSEGSTVDMRSMLEAVRSVLKAAVDTGKKKEAV